MDLTVVSSAEGIRWFQLERPISRYFLIPGSGKLRFQNFSEPGNPGSEKLLLKTSVFVVLDIWMLFYILIVNLEFTKNVLQTALFYHKKEIRYFMTFWSTLDKFYFQENMAYFTNFKGSNFPVLANFVSRFRYWNWYRDSDVGEGKNSSRGVKNFSTWGVKIKKIE